MSFVYLLKEPTFSFIDLCYCFLRFYFIYFCSDLYDFFPSTDLGFLCSSFSSCFRCKVRLLIWDFSFFVISVSGFAIRVMVALWNEFGSVLPSAIFLEEFEKDRCYLFSKCLIEFACEAVWSWTVVCWKILIIVSISLLVIGLFIFSNSSWFSLGKLYLSRNLSISSRLSILLAYSCLSLLWLNVLW